MIISIEKIRKFITWKKEWSNSYQMGISNYISFNIQPDDVLILSKLFFPDFIEFDTCVFLKENFSETNYFVWKEQLNNNNSLIEKVINEIHVYDIFANNDENIEEFVFEEIGKVLQYSWASHLKNIFPTKSFIVDYENNENSYGPTLIIYQASVEM